ncbi:unnamed protein product, partial [Polarella glacialis]
MSAASDGRRGKKGRVVPQRDRVFSFRDFVLQTFSREELQSGAVLDVAGGKGDLSWILVNADGINAVVVDPRVTDHTKILRTALWHWEHKDDDESSIAAQRGPQGPIRSLGLRPPFATPQHLRMYFDDALVAALGNVGAEGESERLMSAWASFWAQACERAEAAEPCGHHQAPKDAPDEVIDVPRARRIHDETAARQLLEVTRLILGFHPDQATEACIDLALKLRVPFAVCPCCVFPKEFPGRLLQGQRVKTYPEFIDYLQLKHPGIRTADLEFEPEGGYARSTVLYMLPSDFDVAETLRCEECIHSEAAYDDALAAEECSREDSMLAVRTLEDPDVMDAFAIVAFEWDAAWMVLASDYDEDQITDLISRIQVYVFPRRIRVKEFFHDFDSLRHGRCTGLNFGRALNTIGLQMTDEEVDALTQHFTQEGPNIKAPQVVNYVKFCEAVDEVFINGHPAAQALSSSPSSTQLMSFKPKDFDEEDRLMHALHRLAMLCKTRGVQLKHEYSDFDRAPVASPSRTNSYMGGKVTKNQFIRKFPFNKEMPKEDIELLADKYMTEQGDIHFMAMHNDISEVTSHEAPPFPRSDLILKPDHSEWSQSRITAVDKIRSKAVEKRVRLYEHFQDFDPLRKGFCTSSQVKTVFTILNLAKDIGRVDFEQLIPMYTRDDGLFCYKDFCADVDREFCVPNLERDPLAQTSMPDASSTMAARRNKVQLTHDRLAHWNLLEDKMRSKIKKDRINLLPAFKDMDKTNNGHISVNQFYRVMIANGFPSLSEEEVVLLSNIYCDLGNHLDYNYVDFMKSVDVPDEEVEIAMAQLQAPYQGDNPAQYFDARGKVIRMSDELGPRMALACRSWVQSLEAAAGSRLKLVEGAEFGGSHYWWGKRQARPGPHEGVDLSELAAPEDPSTASPSPARRLPVGFPVPAVADGEIVAIFPDFLGTTIVMKHQETVPDLSRLARHSSAQARAANE